MWREIMDDLKAWKERKLRQPLIIRGVRQCGKTYVMREFGRECYRDVAYFNLESDRGARTAFEGDLGPEAVVDRLSMERGARITEETLIILDEIQCSPDAVTSLKYFAEDAPQYHVVCAGSLLGVTEIGSGGPVGKVDTLTLRPMDFHEWMVANGEEALWEGLSKDVWGLSQGLLDRLEALYRTYLFVGGMPRAVSAWLETRDEGEVRLAQEAILNWYSNDFLGHAPGDADKIYQIWHSIPAQLGTESGRFIFSHVRKSGRARDLEGALTWLLRAGLVYKVPAAEKPSYPLGRCTDDTVFKLYMCDVGLMGAMEGVTRRSLAADGEAGGLYRGIAAETFALTEMMSFLKAPPAYWREAGMEVDFLIQHGEGVWPVEVKSGGRARARSLKEYVDRYGPERAFVLSLGPAGDGRVARIPVYVASLIPRIAARCRRSPPRTGCTW